MDGKSVRPLELEVLAREVVRANPAGRSLGSMAFGTESPLGHTQREIRPRSEVAREERRQIVERDEHEPRCDEGCQGLCPVCGCNRNHESCVCSDQSVSRPLARLGELIEEASTGDPDRRKR